MWFLQKTTTKHFSWRFSVWNVKNVLETITLWRHWVTWIPHTVMDKLSYKLKNIFRRFLLFKILMMTCHIVYLWVDLLFIWIRLSDLWKHSIITSLLTYLIICNLKAIVFLEIRNFQVSSAIISFLNYLHSAVDISGKSRCCLKKHDPFECHSFNILWTFDKI